MRGFATGCQDDTFTCRRDADRVAPEEQLDGLRTVRTNVEPERQVPGDDHPAPMPINLAHRCVTLTSEPGDVVLDPYAGSGTTLLAAAQLRRRWVGIELKAEFVRLIERRMST